MRLIRTKMFKRSYAKAPLDIQQSAYKAIRFLAKNFQHPSLRAKKFDEGQNIWQCRITQSWRLYFQLEEGAIILLQMKKHVLRDCAGTSRLADRDWGQAHLRACPR